MRYAAAMAFCTCHGTNNGGTGNIVFMYWLGGFLCALMYVLMCALKHPAGAPAAH